MDALMDPNDQALMDGLSALGPLLLGNRRLQEVHADEQHNKRHKSKARNDSNSEGPKPEAIHTMLRLMGQLLLSHERSLQLSQRQDCFVMFCQNRPEGIVPHLTCLAKTSDGRNSRTTSDGRTCAPIWCRESSRSFIAEFSSSPTARPGTSFGTWQRAKAPSFPMEHGGFRSGRRRPNN